MILIYSTFPDLSTAKVVAQRLLSRRLVACVNILPATHSLYRWQGELEESVEVITLFKTQDHLFEECRAEICKGHPYQVPCVLQIEVKQGELSYLNWVKEETK